MAVLGAFHASKYSEIKLLLGSRRNPVRRLLKLPACWFLNQRFGSQQGELNAPGGCAASWLTKKHKSRVLVFFTCVFLKKIFFILPPLLSWVFLLLSSFLFTPCWFKCQLCTKAFSISCTFFCFFSVLSFFLHFLTSSLCHDIGRWLCWNMDLVTLPLRHRVNACLFCTRRCRLPLLVFQHTQITNTKCALSCQVCCGLVVVVGFLVCSGLVVSTCFLKWVCVCVCVFMCTLLSVSVWETQHLRRRLPGANIGVTMWLCVHLCECVLACRSLS